MLVRGGSTLNWGFARSTIFVIVYLIHALHGDLWIIDKICLFLLLAHDNRSQRRHLLWNIWTWSLWSLVLLVSDVVPSHLLVGVLHLGATRAEVALGHQLLVPLLVDYVILNPFGEVCLFLHLVMDFQWVEVTQNASIRSLFIIIGRLELISVNVVSF